jgi:lauroyl/myristoyl acyltransferase
LSRRTGALVLPAVIVRLPGRRYAAHFERPLTPENVTQENHFEVIRSYLRRYPGQWFAFEPLPRGLA